MTKKMSYEELEEKVKSLESELSDRMRKQEALRLSNERILKIFHESPDTITLSRLSDGKIIDVNKTFEKMFGIPREVAIGQTTLALGLWPDPKAREPFIARIRADGFLHNFEHRQHRRASGEIFHVSSSGELIELDGHTCILAHIRDISDRKRMEEKLSESEKKYQALFHNAQAALFRTSMDGKIIDINKRYVQMAGYSDIEDCKSEFISGKAWRYPGFRDDFLKTLQKKGYVRDYEAEIIRGDGAHIWILISAKLYPDQGFIEGSIVEITDRKQAEDALRRSEEKFKHIFEAANVGKSVTSPEGKMEVNKAFCGMLGYAPDELRNKTWQELTPPDEVEAVQNILNSLLNGEKGSARFEKRLFHKNGSFIWADVSVAIQKDAEGKPVHFIITVVDITDRKHAEAEKEKITARLNQIQKMEAIGTLAGGIAHDFNNMLGVITGNISYALSKVNKNDELYDVLFDVNNSSKKGQNLTHQLLTFSKGGTPIKKISHINKLINDSVVFSIRGSRSTCKYELADDLWPAEVDEGQIHQVISNLIINADQAMPNGGIITIRTENTKIETDSGLPLPAGQYIKIAIEDQGVGILKKHLVNIFDPYFTTKQKGSGLGLSTTYSIIKKHGGHITVYSEIDKGTVFNIYLPVFAGDAKKNEDKKESAHTGQGRILIMDDQEPILKMLGRMLNLMGYETTFATDGSEAIELYRDAYQSKNHFGLVILDLTVPGGMGGAKTIPELLKIDPKVKAVVSSGYSNDPIMANYGDYGFFGVIPKPYTKDQLSELLNNIFRE
jgi:PAS domain S-box-containing protein